MKVKKNAELSSILGGEMVWWRFDQILTERIKRKEALFLISSLTSRCAIISLALLS